MLAAGIDARDGIVQVEGWVQGASVSALELASRMASVGYEHLIYTDIARDGMQTGIAPAAYVEMSQAFGNPVIASGGIASLDDIAELSRVSDAIEGVIAGRAIYEGNFSVSAAVAACEKTAFFDPGFAEGLETPFNAKDLQ
jgi:phosphoribosylformimino-5-aminoimidazole carboxamide ribotide isomerase